MIRLTILGEPASKANSREIVSMTRRPVRCRACQTLTAERDRACSNCGKSFVGAASVKSKKAQAYERDALRQIPPMSRVMLQGPVKVTLRIFYASERPDLDESVVLDVLQAKFVAADGKARECVRRGVYLNDRQVREKHVYHAIDRKNPRAEIEVEPIIAELFARTSNDPIAEPVMLGDIDAERVPF